MSFTQTNTFSFGTIVLPITRLHYLCAAPSLPVSIKNIVTYINSDILNPLSDSKHILMMHETGTARGWRVKRKHLKSLVFNLFGMLSTCISLYIIFSRSHKRLICNQLHNLLNFNWLLLIKVNSAKS